MKKVIGIIAVIAAIAIIGMSLNNKISSQPAQAGKAVSSKTVVVLDTENTTDDAEASTERKKREGFWCQVNGDGTITYGSASWSGWWIFGHWEYGVGNTMPGGANSCAAFLDGVNTVQAP